MAGEGGDDVPPTLVDNVETIANIPRIIGRGAAWFRTEGTEKSPGTIVCTVTGSVQRAGVGEVIMGTPLREAIELIGGGPRPGHRIKAVMAGVSAPLITADQLDTPLSYEDMAAIGSGLGAGGFIVFDDSDDLAAVAAGVSRFLAVESCGQCVPCKIDGLALADRLARLARSDATTADLAKIKSLASTVGDRARCFLATQHQDVIGSIIDSFGPELEAHVGRYGAGGVEPILIAELVDISGDTAVLDEHHLDKQPDWTFGPRVLGQGARRALRRSPQPPAPRRRLSHAIGHLRGGRHRRHDRRPPVRGRPRRAPHRPGSALLGPGLAAGLELRSPDRTVTLPVPVVDHPRSVRFGPDDVVLLTMKTQDTVAALETLAAVAPPDVAVISAQNGVANEPLALRHFPRVYGMCVMLPANHLSPGIVRAGAAPVTGILDVGCYPLGVDPLAHRWRRPCPLRRSIRGPSPGSCAASTPSC